MASSSFSEMNKREKAIILLELVRIHEEKNKKTCSCWVKTWRNENKQAKQSCFHQLMNELRLSDAEGYRGYIRMVTNTFQSILRMITSIIAKEDTHLRGSFSPGEHLSLTLRYLATGEMFRSLAHQFRVAHNSISVIIPEVLDAIYQSYKSEYLRVPSTVCEWEDIAREFDEMWQFPHCLGAIDGKHVQIICPKQSGSAYYNYKGFYSVVMMSIVRADLSFIYVDAGTNGRQSDSSIWNASNLKKAINDGKLNFPPDSPLQSGGQPIPYLFVTDEGIGMSSRVMRPYPMKQLTAEKSIFNYRLSRATRVVENAFGILTSVWRVFSTVILLSPDKAAKIILTCCVLHNMLRERKIKSYLTVATSDNFGEQHQQFTPLESSRNLNPSTAMAKAIRDESKTYFNTVGQVEWQ
ncbi:uncharacterized protein [Centruroides vittatus]|uniref:uncharacterized protein n=1 Tax=Centruroides vittatus TaxID=120091 RepID=UPI00350EAC41